MPLPEDHCMMLYQSVRELLINVVKHANTSRAKVCLSLDASQQLRIVVQDSGPGFDMAAQTMTAVGRHFGLESIRERMEAMGGTLQMETGPNQGTKVILRLPLGSTNKVEEDAPTGVSLGVSLSEHTQTALSSEKTNAVRVMLVDDHKLVRQGLRTALEAYEDVTIVVEASNGLEAICLAAEEMPDVIVMDVGLPNMDGIEAARQIKAIHPQAMIIAITADNPSSHAATARRAGAAACISKEVDLGEFHNMIVSLARRQ
jgi:CheY-like chemotaxis protein